MAEKKSRRSFFTKLMTIVAGAWVGSGWVACDPEVTAKYGGPPTPPGPAPKYGGPPTPPGPAPKYGGPPELLSAAPALPAPSAPPPGSGKAPPP